jgi:trehalose 6-phosphate synthase
MTPHDGEGRSRLIVVSNREPYEHRRLKGRLVCQRTDGGLTSALDPVLRRLGGTWIAWGSGDADRETVDSTGALNVPPESPTYRLRRVWLSSDEVRGAYRGYANQVLWPLCHITLDRVAYRKSYWPQYVAMNRRFLEAVLEEMRPCPGAVWIHDFHLALLPALIKRERPATVVSVFWHVPWPGSEVFRILPERQDLLEGLLAADTLGFQTAGYAHAFAECARDILKAEISPDGSFVRHKGRGTRLCAHPISADFQLFNERAQSPEVERHVATARRRFASRPGMRVGLGVDRLDYTKGLVKRLWALDLFFTKFPQYRGAFTFVQVAIPTRTEIETYRQYRDLITQTVDEINGRHGTESWRPIVYCEGRIPLDTLLAYYRMADLALVSSVYDGMNLVAKEYVASRVDETGVLLISQMTGSAEELTEALVINPYDLDGLADAIRQALEMPVEEQLRRMRVLRAHVQAHDVHAWVTQCLHDLDLPASSVHERDG